MSTISVREPSFLDPDRLYSKRGFHAASGVSETRVRLARQKFGLTLTWIVCGKRKFLRGADAIKFIELLSEIEQRQGA